MSGSPVYIDGRLIGAVSYSIGAFSKEPIAGITPIAEMKDATVAAARARGTAQARLELPVTPREPDGGADARPTRALAPFADRPADVQSIGMPAAAGAQLGAMLRPIATPLLMGGFEPATRRSRRRRVPRRRLHADGHRRRPAADAGRRRPGRCAKATRSASRSSAATSRWARPAPSRTSTATASTPSAIRSSTSARPSSR